MTKKPEKKWWTDSGRLLDVGEITSFDMGEPFDLLAALREEPPDPEYKPWIHHIIMSPRLWKIFKETWYHGDK